MLKIMLVDDHALFRAGLRMLLDTMRQDICVFEAGALTEALALAQAHPDLGLCLLDLELRQEFGLRALDRLRLMAPAVAVVVVSASEEPGTIRACIDAGAMSYLSKGMEPALLKEALSCVLGGGVFLPPMLGWDDGESVKRPVLTPRQRDVMRLLCQGLPTKLIARKLSLSEHTVKEHISAVLVLLGAKNRTEAVIKSSRLKA